MTFEPRPPNPFSEFSATYFERCRAVCPKLLAMAAKWNPEDLIPGLSDFDTRFIVQNDTKAVEWAAMSVDVGRVHAELTRKRPEWARILEHLPGINLTVEELRSPVFYSAEFRQWSWYHGEVETMQRIESEFSPWSRWDETYHWTRFAQFWGPYQVGIDPPINLGPFARKYALHSRYMHYFAPPVQAAVSLALRRTVRGKTAALGLARELFPMAAVIDETLEAIDRHYEVPDAYSEEGLSEIQRRLESYLDCVFQRLTGEKRWSDFRAARTPKALREAVSRQAESAVREYFGRVRFFRLMRGRLEFYSERIRWFETEWLIQNELRRLGDWACRRPLVAFVHHTLGASVDFERAVMALEGDRLSAEEANAFRLIVALTDTPIVPGKEREMARAVAEHFELVHLALERLGSEMLRRVNGGPVETMTQECSGGSVV